MTFGKRLRWSYSAWSNWARLTSVGCVTTAMLLGGCGYFQLGGSDAAAQKARDEKTREEVAKATENARPELQEAGRKLGAAAKTAADDAKAAAQGVREGWSRNGHGALDLNSATEADLVTLQGVSHRDARRIIANRPYADRHDVVTKGALTEDQYQDIREGIAAK